jgi:hypothetical protein
MIGVQRFTVDGASSASLALDAKIGRSGTGFFGAPPAAVFIGDKSAGAVAAASVTAGAGSPATVGTRANLLSR